MYVRLVLAPEELVNAEVVSKMDSVMTNVTQATAIIVLDL